MQQPAAFGRSASVPTRRPRTRACVRLAAWLVLFIAGPAVAGRDVSMQAFTQDQGLRSLGANALLRDRRGVVWVGTDSGLFRFDGSAFVAVDAPAAPAHLQVMDLYRSPAGRIWIGTARRLYQWRHGRLQPVAELPVPDLRRLAGDGGEGVFVRAGRRLWHVGADGRSAAVTWPRALRSGTLTDGPLLWYDDHLWTSCGAELCQRSGTGTRVWGVADGVPADTWITLHAGADGDLWVGGAHHLLHLRAGARRFEAIPADGALEVLELDAQGRVLAAGGGRIRRWDGARWQVFGDAEGLQSAQIRDLLFDAAGAVWVASGGRGVLRWRGYGQFENWGRAQGLDSAPTWAIARDADGRLWLGNQRFGNLLEPGAQRLQPWPEALRRGGWRDAVAVLPRGRRMWILFNRGTLVRYDLDSGRAEVVGRDLGWAKFGLADTQGRLWFGTHGGLWRVDDADAAQPAVQRMETGLPADTRYPGAAVDGRGRVWFATDRGLLRYAQGRFERLRLRGSAPPPGGFADVAALDGELWLAPVAGGLLRAKATDAGALRAADAGDALLAATALYALETDRSGRLWAVHDAGLDVRIHGRWRRLDRSDGLVWNDLSPGAFLDDGDGSVWLGTSGGVSHVLHPSRIDRPAAAGPVVLGARYGDVHLDPGAGTDIVLAWSGAPLAIRLAVAGLDHPGAQVLQYRLLADGDASAGWERAVGGSVRYAALSPGRYRFQVRVADPYLRTASTATGFALTVRPPWWRSGWAQLAWAALAILALAMLWRLRGARLLRRQHELERLVEVRTRELEADKRMLEAARQALQYEASHDALTGLLNRGATVEALVAALVAATPADPPLAVALIDLDHFKRVNDTYGHLAGDAVLVQCAQRLRGLAPAQAALGRYGGEELLAVWPGLARDTDTDALFAPLLDGDYRDGPSRFRVTCSIGLAWARRGDDVGTLLRRADAALYRAKQGGRARLERAD